MNSFSQITWERPNILCLELVYSIVVFSENILNYYSRITQMRGFRNVGPMQEILIAMLGSDDVGNVTWSQSLLDAAEGKGITCDSWNVQNHIHNGSYALGNDP